jgi:hypothetical protein
MKKEEVLTYIESKGDSSFVIRTEEEENTFLANHAKEVEEKTIGPKIADLHTRYDNDVFSVTGLKKEPTEKSYDFIKRVLGDLKTKAEKASSFEKEISNLTKQIQDGTGDKKTLADLQAMQKAFDDLQTTKDKEITTLKTEHEKYRMKSDILSARAGLQFKKNIPEAAINSLVDQVVNSLIGIGSYQDGKLVFIENGVPMRNTHNALNPFTAQELLKERLKDVIDSGRQVNGGPDLNNEVIKQFDDKGKLVKMAMIIPDNITTKEALSKFLMTSGLLRGTEEYRIAYNTYSEGLKRES